MHSRDVTYAVFCEGPYGESSRYRDFMAWEMPWYSVPGESTDRLIAGRHFGMKVCYLRDGDRRGLAAAIRLQPPRRRIP